MLISEFHPEQLPFHNLHNFGSQQWLSDVNFNTNSKETTPPNTIVSDIHLDMAANVITNIFRIGKL